MIRRQNCPICKKELPVDAASTLKTFPFCNDRCRNVDLFRWAEGKYAIVEPLDPAKLTIEQLEELDEQIPDF